MLSLSVCLTLCLSSFFRRLFSLASNAAASALIPNNITIQMSTIVPTICMMSSMLCSHKIRPQLYRSVQIGDREGYPRIITRSCAIHFKLQAAIYDTLDHSDLRLTTFEHNRDLVCCPRDVEFDLAVDIVNRTCLYLKCLAS